MTPLPLIYGAPLHNGPVLPMALYSPFINQGEKLNEFLRLLYVDAKTNCWLFKGCLNTNGYGRFNLNGKLWNAHRLAYEHFLAVIPDELQVCHKCDVKNCVNPSHLFLGTSQDNQDDKVFKNRQAKGSHNGRAKLTEEDVIEIRRLGAKGERHVDIAKLFGVTQSVTSNIINRSTWRHVK